MPALIRGRLPRRPPGRGGTVRTPVKILEAPEVGGHGGMGKWGMPNVPHKGWSCDGLEDLGEPSHLCEMCETMWVRYVHTMRHKDYPEQLEVGGVCAGHMEENLKAPKLRNLAAARCPGWLEGSKW